MDAELWWTIFQETGDPMAYLMRGEENEGGE